VFDLETLAPGTVRRVADMPASGDRLVAEPVGIDHIIVNGTPVRRDGACTLDQLHHWPGAVVRSRPGGEVAGMKVSRVAGATFGAVVSDVDLRTIDDAVFATIEAVFGEHAVVVFPGQHLDDAAHLAFSRRFGPLERSIVAPPPGQPDGLIGIGNALADGTFVSDPDHQITLAMKANAFWHSDSSYKQPSAKMSLLSARILPSTGGDTEFADMRAGYDMLDDATKTRLEGLVASHSYLVAQARVGGTYEMTADERARLAPVEHPLVRLHPPSGRKSLFLGRHVFAIHGMADADAIALVDELTDVVCRPPRVFRHVWAVGDLVAWDNRCVLHRGRPWDMAEPRVLTRATVTDSAGATNTWAVSESH
jgi:alpha-ketoglutarate-dependent taurine dioxygenase